MYQITRLIIYIRNLFFQSLAGVLGIILIISLFNRLRRSLHLKVKEETFNNVLTLEEIETGEKKVKTNAYIENFKPFTDVEAEKYIISI